MQYTFDISRFLVSVHRIFLNFLGPGPLFDHRFDTVVASQYKGSQLNPQGDYN